VGLLGRGIGLSQDRYLHTKHKQNKRTQIPIPRVELEPTIPVIERAKTVHALARAATVTGEHSSHNAEMTPQINFLLDFPRSARKRHYTQSVADPTYDYQL
jgi:hypothetical protein